MMEAWQAYIAWETETGNINEGRSLYKRCYSKRFPGTGSEVGLWADYCCSWLEGLTLSFDFSWWVTGAGWWKFFSLSVFYLFLESPRYLVSHLRKRKMIFLRGCICFITSSKFKLVSEILKDSIHFSKVLDIVSLLPFVIICCRWLICLKNRKQACLFLKLFRLELYCMYFVQKSDLNSASLVIIDIANY